MCERSFPGKCRMPGHRPLATTFLAVAAMLLYVGTVFAQNTQPALAPTTGHVPELVRYFDRLQLSEPAVFRQFAVYTLQLIDGHLRAETTPDQPVPVLVLDVDEEEASKILATHDPLIAL